LQGTAHKLVQKTQAAIMYFAARLWALVVSYSMKLPMQLYLYNMRFLLLCALFATTISGAKAQAINYVDSVLDLQLPDSLGKWQSMQGFRDKLILVDFWAAWSESSRRYNNPWIANLWREYGARGLYVYSINVDKDYRTWVRAARQDSLGGILVNDAIGCSYKALNNVNSKGIPNKLLFYKGELMLNNAGMYDFDSTIRAILSKP
jgi:thiol-disulfide isomerase/thioredoxin